MKFWDKESSTYVKLRNDEANQAEDAFDCTEAYNSPRMENLENDNNKEDDVKDSIINITRESLNWNQYIDVSKRKKLPERNTTKKVFAQCKNKLQCSSRCIISNIIRLFPIITWLPFYRVREWLIPDLVSGLTVGIMNVPQGMAYALLASLPPVYGLYTSFYPCLFYFIFGTSKHASVGTFAITSLMTSQLVEEFMSKQRHLEEVTTPGTNATVGYDDNLEVVYNKIDVAVTLAFIVGLIQIFMGIFQLGNLVVYMSSEMVSGFFMACGMYVFTSQINNLFGLKFHKHHGVGSLIMNYVEFFNHLNETNVAILLISISSISLLVVVKVFFDGHVQKKIRMPIPADLIIIIIATLFSTYCDFETNFGVDILGEIPVGLIKPAVPNLSLISFEMLPTCVSLAFIMFATSVSVGIVLGKKHKYSIDNNQELFAYGISCSASSFFHCFPASVSMSRSLLISTTGGKTLVSSSVSALLILSVIVSIGSLFEHLPRCVLSAIIVVALRNIMKELIFFRKTWKVSKLDSLVWLVSFFVTVLVDIQFGLLSSILFSLILIILKSQWASCCVLGNIPNTELYADISKYSAAVQIKGIRIIHFGSNLNFSNSTYFLKEVVRLAAIRNKDEESKKENNSLLETSAMSDKENIHSIIIDMSCVSNIDSSGVNTIMQLMEDFSSNDVSLFLAECREPVLSSLFSLEENSIFTTDFLYPSVHDAVSAVRHKS